MAFRFHELRPYADDIPALVPLAFLRRAESLCEMTDEALGPIHAAAESLVLEILGWPESTDGSRTIARRVYTETIVLDAPAPVLDLARRPASVTAVRFDGALADPSGYRVMESTGRIVWRAAWLAPGVEIEIEHISGWRTPAQGAGDGPPLPASIGEAVLRAAQLLGESAARLDGVTIERAEERLDGIFAWSTYRTAGRAVIEREIAPLVDAFRFVASN